MKIEVLGSGCAKCKRLEKNVKKAMKKASIDGDVIKVEDINEIVERGVMITPGLVIDGKMVSTGKVLSPDDIVKLLK